MNYLLDTCVISEVVARRPAARVLRWLADQGEEGLYLSVVSVGEIRRGIERLPGGNRKAELDRWLRESLLLRFGRRCLPIDENVMAQWGVLVASLEAIGRPMSAFDALLAATALLNGLTLVTRNESDFEDSGVPLLNPWR